MEYVLLVNSYFLTKVLATSLNGAVYRITHMTTDENMFESVKVFGTFTEEGDIPFSDMHLYMGYKYIDYVTLTSIINEYDYLYSVCKDQMERQYYYAEQIELGNNEYKDALEVTNNVIDFISKQMEKVYWTIHEKR